MVCVCGGGADKDDGNTGAKSKSISSLQADCTSKLRGRLYFQRCIFTAFYSGGDIWYLS